ncbi:hypothetical protein EG328_001887 [Venturia inaequalis]|uniref:Uncharacterized protein n=1 Tax=Venturia inaequalis TaxID=5025 RepID=A0A8H3UUX7_VENIN|nr:hypothetical protein EG328_001887 [Venturia inaequalis]
MRRNEGCEDWRILTPLNFRRGSYAQDDETGFLEWMSVDDCFISNLSYDFSDDAGLVIGVTVTE